MNTALAKQDLAIALARNPPARPAGPDDLPCPWCGEDQMDNIDTTVDLMCCEDCGRPFEMHFKPLGDITLVGKITDADKQYLDWLKNAKPSDKRSSDHGD